MLRGIHKASANWLGRAIMGIVLGLIAISFGIWGIGDIFRGFGLSTLAKVGGTEIGIEQFRQIYNDRLQELSRRIGRPVTPEQARALGFDRQILGQLIADTALDERVRDLKLGIPESEIVRIITEDPTFRGVTGQFDHNRFLQAIRQAGYTEPRYFAEQRRQILRNQLGTAFTAEVMPPKILIDAFHRYQNEQRTIEYVVLNRAQAGDVPAPTPEALNKYYEERKILFRAPEYRKISMLVLTPAHLISSIEVSDADVKRAYDERQSRYVVPERRQVQQILFPNIDEARAASDRLTKGLTFDALAAEPAVKDRYSDLGIVTKARMIDPAFADAAFALKASEVSAPITGQFGVAILRVVKIEPGQTQPFEKVAPDIKRELAMERATREVQSVRDKVEDERLDGKTLAQAAEKLGLKLRTIEAIDRSGRDPDGKPIADLPAGVDVVSAAFQSDVGADNESLPIQGGGTVWFDVVSVTPSRDRPLDEVKSQVETRWRDDQISDRLKAKTTEMLDKLKNGATLAELAAADNLKVQTATGLRRGNAMTGFPLRALNEIFRVAKGASGVADGETATDRIVFRVTDIAVPPFDPETPEAKRVIEAMQRSIADEIFSQYVQRAQNDVGVTINENALNQVIGGAASN
jgi:peptidyl-prolyl cis-trans isomerase D